MLFDLEDSAAFESFRQYEELAHGWLVGLSSLVDEAAPSAANMKFLTTYQSGGIYFPSTKIHCSATNSDRQIELRQPYVVTPKHQLINNYPHLLQF